MGRRMNHEHEPEANVDTIVHLGAGTCSDLARWQAANPRRIVLVEPNPHHTHHLTAHARGDERVHVFQQAVGDPGASPRLRRFNIPALSSLREPTGLLEIFPGLHTERELDVEVIETPAFVQSLELETDHKHWLVIDTPGEEAAIVNALHASGQLNQFERIVLRCGVEPLYRDSERAAVVLGRLREAGYDIEQRDDSDPDRPSWTLDRNALRLDNQALRLRIAELEQQTNELAQERDKRANEAEETHKALERMQDDLSVALRVQHLRDADLKELQGRYEKMLTVKERQDELLAKLTSRLELAAHHLQALETESNPDEQGDLRNLIHALAGDRDQ